MDNKDYFVKIKENIDTYFNNIQLLEKWEYYVHHYSINSAIGEIYRFAKRKGYELKDQDVLQSFGYKGFEHAKSNFGKKVLDKTIDNVEDVLGIFGPVSKMLGWGARKLFSSNKKQVREFDLYKNNIKQREKIFVEIINRDYRFDLKMEIR